MKPRTFTIAAVVLAVIGVSGFVAGGVLSSRVDETLRRVKILSEQHGSLVNLDESQKAQVMADLEESTLTSARSGRLSLIGFGAMMLAVWSNTFRLRSKHKLAVGSMDQDGGATGKDQPPIATVP